MQIFLRDHVATACESCVFRANEGGVDHRLSARVLGAVDEPQKVAVVEVAKAVHLVDRGHRIAEPPHDLRRHLEAQVHPLGADMEQEIARSGDCVARSSPELAERVKFGRTRVPEQPIPGVGADSHHAGEPSFEVTKFNRANQAREVSAKGAHGGAIVLARVDCHHQEDRSACERR